MSCSVPFQWYRSQIDVIWPDGTFNYIRVTIYAEALPHYIGRGPIYPARFIYCLILVCIKAIIHISALTLCHDNQHVKENSMQVNRFFTIIKF